MEGLLHLAFGAGDTFGFEQHILNNCSAKYEFMDDSASRISPQRTSARRLQLPAQVKNDNVPMHTISAQTHHMRVDYSMFEGIQVTGMPDIVLSRGKIIVAGDKFLGRAGQGEFLKRSTYAQANG